MYKLHTRATQAAQKLNSFPHQPKTALKEILFVYCVSGAVHHVSASAHPKDPEALQGIIVVLSNVIL